MLKGMKRRFLFAVLASLLGVGAWAQGSGARDSAQGLYNEPLSYLPADSGIGAPSGMLGIGVPSGPEGFTGAFAPGTPQQLETDLVQGCGTVGINDYQGQLFNNEQTFDQFRSQDVNSELARQLLTYNYSMPQTAALFGQLNQFGADRFRNFQQGCALSTQQADARTQYVRECVQAVLQNNSIDLATLQPNSSTGAPEATEAELRTRRTARAYEMCTQQYTTSTRTLMAQSQQSFAESQRAAQDVNGMIKPLLCPAFNNTAGPAAPTTCWANLFLPQVRLCAEGNPDCAGTTNNGFGVRAAPLTASVYLDVQRVAIGKALTEKTLAPFRQSLVSIDNATQKLAAQSAMRLLAATTGTAAPNQNLQAFQGGFLNCREAEMTAGLKAFGDALTTMMQGNRAVTTNSNGAGTEDVGFSNSVSIIPFGTDDYTPLIQRIWDNPATRRPDKGSDNTDLNAQMAIAAGCAINQDVPFLDPILTANLATCGADDQNAFYTMAAMDVATAATRNTLRYVAQQLNAALGQLEAGGAEPISFTSGSQIIPLRLTALQQQRAAVAVRTIMLPSIQQQLERLDELEQRRGAFAQRVSKLYNEKTGCLFSR
jgi:hypothetical protein